MANCVPPAAWRVRANPVQHVTERSSPAETTEISRIPVGKLIMLPTSQAVPRDDQGDDGAMSIRRFLRRLCVSLAMGFMHCPATGATTE